MYTDIKLYVKNFNTMKYSKEEHTHPIKASNCKIYVDTYNKPF